MTLLRAGAMAIALVLAGCGPDATTAGPEPSPPLPTDSQASPGVSSTPDPLVPGRWSLEVNGDRTGAPSAEVEVPEGYEVRLREHGDDVGAPFAGGPFVLGVDESGSEEVTRAVGYWTVSGVHRDPCAKTGLRDPGPAVEDLAEALVHQKLTEATKPVPVTLDGHDGLYLELTAPNIDLATCPHGDVQYWDSAPGGSRYTDRPRAVDRVWILDVDGVRVVLNTYAAPDVRDTEVDELVAIVESVEFVGS